MTPEITRADVIERRAQWLWRYGQPWMNDTEADLAWAAIDESERTRYRIEAARLPGGGER
jgi:hypothetical protein